MIFRIRFRVAGGHVHCRLFSAKSAEFTFACCGSFVVNRGKEFVALMEKFRAEFIADEGSTTQLAAHED